MLALPHLACVRPHRDQRASLAGLATRLRSRDPTPIFEEGGIQVFLRSDVRWMRTVEKGYSHPVTIAPVRVAHILSRIDLKPPSGFLVSFEGEKERVPAISDRCALHDRRGRLEGARRGRSGSGSGRDGDPRHEAAGASSTTTS